MSACGWCGAAFAARASGRRQRFCSPACRRDFFATARAWAAAEIEAGRLPVATLRAFVSTCTLPACAKAGEGEERARRPLPNVHVE